MLLGAQDSRQPIGNLIFEISYFRVGREESGGMRRTPHASRGRVQDCDVAASIINRSIFMSEPPVKKRLYICKDHQKSENYVWRQDFVKKIHYKADWRTGEGVQPNLSPTRRSAIRQARRPALRAIPRLADTNRGGTPLELAGGTGRATLSVSRIGDAGDCVPAIALQSEQTTSGCLLFQTVESGGGG